MSLSASSFLNQALSFLLPEQPLKATGEKWPSWPVATEDAGSAPGAQPWASTRFPHSFPGRCESQVHSSLTEWAELTWANKKEGREEHSSLEPCGCLPEREERPKYLGWSWRTARTSAKVRLEFGCPLRTQDMNPWLWL